MNDSSEPETFAQEISRQRTAASAEEDAELIKALETLKKIIERPARAPRGIHDVWGWSVGNEHARQPDTETREQVLERIRRSYQPDILTPSNRPEQERAALETIAAVLESLKNESGTSKHDLKRTVKALEAIIADRIGPGDASLTDKGSKLLLLPGEKTGRELSEEIAKPVDRPIKKVPNDYIHIHSNEHPVIKSLVEQWGLTAVWVEIQRMRRGMLESNREIAVTLAKVAEEIDDLREDAPTQEVTVKQASPVPAAGPAQDNRTVGPVLAQSQPLGRSAISDSIDRLANAESASPSILSEVLRRVADEYDALQKPDALSPLTLDSQPEQFGNKPKKGPEKIFRETLIHAEGGIEISAYKELASIKARHLSISYTIKTLDPDLVAKSGKYYPFTDEFVDFFRAAENLIKEREKLTDERIEASNRGYIASLRLKWDDDKKGVKRPEYWQFRPWADNFIARFKEISAVPDWDLLKELKNWNKWGPKPPSYHNTGP